MAEPDRRSSKWDIVKWLTIVSLLVGIVIGLGQIYLAYLKPDPPAVSVQYVVDVSSGMAGSIGKQEKLAAVKDEVLSAVGGTPDIAYSLRVSGPDCSRAYVPPSVGFAEDNADEFEDVLTPLRAEGTSDFARSVRYAVNDLVAQQGKEGSKSASLFFLIGGRDRCTKRPADVIAKSLQFLEQQKTIDVNFKFVGVKVPKEIRRLLNRTKKRAKRLGFGATVDYANTPAEIGESVRPPEPEPEGPSG